MTVLTELLRKTFTVYEYHRMVEVGIIHEDDRVELIEGDIFYMAPMGSLHRKCLMRLSNIFKYLRERTLFVMQMPITLNQTSDPKPDVMLLVPSPDAYTKVDPKPQDVLLLIEVSLSTIKHDPQKAILYGKAGIIELWIVNLEARLVEIYREPTDRGYASIQEFRPGENISPLAFPDLGISVDEILGIS